MKSVSECDSNNKMNVTITNNGNFCRHLSDKRKVIRSGTGDRITVPAKRTRYTMDTSTPHRYRETGTCSSPDNSPIRGREDSMCEISTERSTDNVNKKSDLFKETSQMVLSTGKPAEELVEVLADKVVAIENMNQAELNYSTKLEE